MVPVFSFDGDGPVSDNKINRYQQMANEKGTTIYDMHFNANPNQYLVSRCRTPRIAQLLVGPAFAFKVFASP